jgi:tetratricopeptide (TPR) repeat protein
VSAAPPPRRNDPCPCGSGRRYKECHGRIVESPESVEALVRHALQLHQQGHLDEAERRYGAILEREPGNPVATHYLGMLAWQRGDAREGERRMREALAANAAIPDFHNNLGLLLRDARRLDEAIACFRRTLELDPGWYEASNNLALALEDAGRFDEAIAAYGSALSTEPSFAPGHQNLARLLLLTERFAQGWEEYRWRLLAQGLSSTPPDPGRKRLPQSLAGKRLLLLSEQGIGDVLFFLRFAPALTRRGAVLAFEGDPRLHGMLTRTGLFAGRVGARVERQGFDEAIFVGDLPWLVEAVDPVRHPPLALRPLFARVERMRARLAAAGPRPYTAITWRAGVASLGPVRSQLKEAPVDLMAKHLVGREGTFVSIQRNPRDGETAHVAGSVGKPVHDFSATNDDLEDMLALLFVVDDYVGMSNANMHLRAGVDLKMNVLVPFPPEWRWQIGGRSTWFRHAELTRMLPVR